MSKFDTNQVKKRGVGIGVIILKDSKILMGKRHSDARKADSELHGEGTWTMPGGKLLFGESFEEAAWREVWEETGVKINKDKLKVISVTNDIVKDAHHVTIGLLYEGFEGEPRVMEPDEIIEWQWFSLDKIPKPLFMPSEKLLNNYLHKEFYKF